MADPTADQAIKDAIDKYHECIRIHLDPIGHPEERKHGLHGAYAGHYAAIAVLLHALQQTDTAEADRIAGWLDHQDAESIHEWMCEHQETSHART